MTYTETPFTRQFKADCEALRKRIIERAKNENVEERRQNKNDLAH